MDDRLRQEVFDTYGVYVKACRDNDVPALNMLIHRYPLAYIGAGRTTLVGTYPVQPADLNPEEKCRHGRRRAPEVHIEAVAREGQGIYSLDIYRPAEVPEMIARAASGNFTPQTKFVASMVWQFLAKRGIPRSALCFWCGGLVDRAAALAALAPHIAQPKKAIGHAICPACDGTGQERRDRVITTWRAVDPSSRPIEVHPTEGWA